MIAALDKPKILARMGRLLEQIQDADRGCKPNESEPEPRGDARRAEELRSKQRDHGGSEPEEYAGPAVIDDLLRKPERLHDAVAGHQQQADCGQAQREELAERKAEVSGGYQRSEEHTSELQSPCNLGCR